MCACSLFGFSIFAYLGWTNRPLKANVSNSETLRTIMHSLGFDQQGTVHVLYPP